VKKILEPENKIDVFAEADVIVVGGGPAGIGAALAAGRNGAKTILIERFGSLGGLQTQGNNPIFTFVDPELHNGIIQDILSGLGKAGALKDQKDLPAYQSGRMKKLIMQRVGADKLPKRLVRTDVGYWGVWGVTFDQEYYKLLLDNMIQEAGVKLLFHAFAVGSIRKGNSLQGIMIECKEGRKAVLGKVIIDTTGEGDISWKSGAAVLGDGGFPVGARKGHGGGMLNAFFIGGVDMKKFYAFREANMEDWGQMYGGRELVKQEKAKGAHIIGESVVLASHQDVYNNGRIYVMNAIHETPPGKRSWMTEVQTDCEIDLRKQMWAVHKMLKENVPGFENSYVEKTPVLYCTGQAHRLQGEYVLTVGDMRSGRAFDDGVVINNMPPDLYEAVGRFGYEILPHDVPYRSLVSKELENLLAAGTTISCGEFSVHGLRYCTPSICTGQAAGTAAALAVKNRVTPKMLDVKLLQNALRKDGARVTVKDLSEEALEPYRFIQSLGIKYQRGDVQQTYATEEEIDKN
jgi:hypothetical protein